MTNAVKVFHESLRLTPEAPYCDVYGPADKGLLQEYRDEFGAFVISPGLGSIKADYKDIAVCLAGQGFEVFSPNCNEALPDSQESGALDRRAEVMIRIITEWCGKSRILAHSLGGVATAIALKKLGVLDNTANDEHPIVSASFMQPAGFDRHGPADLFRASKFYFGEAIPRTGKLLPVLTRDPKSVYERFNPRQRAAEIRELWDLPADYMINTISLAQEAGLFMNFFLGPKDQLTRPGPIRRAVVPIVGEHNVHDIHRDAGHLAGQTHAPHTASLVIKHLGLPRLDSNSLLLQRAS
jgi:hypothetical protein